MKSSAFNNNRSINHHFKCVLRCRLCGLLELTWRTTSNRRSKTREGSSWGACWCSRISEYSRIRDIQRWDKTFSLQFKELFVTWGGGFLYSPIFKLFFFSYDFLNTFDVNTLLIYLDLLPTGRPTNCRPINPPNLAHCTILWSFAVSIIWFTSNLLNLSLSFTPISSRNNYHRSGCINSSISAILLQLQHALIRHLNPETQHFARFY